MDYSPWNQSRTGPSDDVHLLTYLVNLYCHLVTPYPNYGHLSHWGSPKYRQSILNTESILK